MIEMKYDESLNNGHSAFIIKASLQSLPSDLHVNTAYWIYNSYITSATSRQYKSPMIPVHTILETY